jgi:septum formation protein
MNSEPSATPAQAGPGTPARVVLASQSPRRRELLALIGVPHEVVPADVDETPFPHEAPAAYTERLARAKAAAVAHRFPDAATIGSDTTVVIDGMILGKPEDAADARRVLRVLSGRTHTVHTAVAVARGDRLVSGVEDVAVTFRRLDDDEIAEYVATGEPMDKAGAYAAQGKGALLVERIEGDFWNVVGLPLATLGRLMQSHGAPVETWWR